MDNHTKVYYEGQLVPLSEVDALLKGNASTSITIEVLYREEWNFDQHGLCTNPGSCERLTWRQVAIAQAIGDSSFPDETIEINDYFYHFFVLEDGSVFAEEAKYVAVYQNDAGFYCFENFDSLEEYEMLSENQEEE